MISALRSLLHFEWRRISRSRMRSLAIVVFFLCGLYAIGSGVHHVKEWERTLAELDEREQTQREQALGWFDAGKTGPDGRTAINVTQPRWADRYAAAHAVMVPEPLAALAIGLSDVRSSWAPVSASGTKSFQASDPSALGNAEKLLVGNFDLVFVFAYLMPLLLLVLLFDVGSLERDLGMLRLVRTQVRSPRSWWIQRLLFPILVVAGLVGLLCVLGGLWTGAIGSTFQAWLAFSGLALVYTIVWGILFGAVLSAGTGTSAAALWMVGLWLGFCVLVPATVRQVVGRDHPSLFSSELTTALRAERYEILLGDLKQYEAPFYAARPELSPPSKPLPRSTTANMSRYVKHAAFLDEVASVTARLSKDEVAREAAVASFGWVNPAYVLQRALCVLAGTESVSYRQHRERVLESVSARLEAVVEAQWGMQAIDRTKFRSLFAHGPRRSYGLSPEPGTYTHLFVLAAAALVAGGFFGRLRRSQERKTGVV